MWTRVRINPAWLAVLILAGPAVFAADDAPVITLINGAVVNGPVTEVTGEGIRVSGGSSAVVYPWYALSPGTRYRYDASYRMNLPGYLEGVDPSQLTNAPDPDYDPLHPEPEPEPGPDTAETAVSTAFALTRFALPAGVTPAGEPALSVLSIDGYSFCALQYGPGEKDILLSGFSPDDPPRLAVLDLARPPVLTEEASEREAAGIPVYGFPRRTLQTAVDDIGIEYRLQWLAEKARADRRYLQCETELVRGTRRASFVLTGRPRGFTAAGEPADVVPLLQEPAVAFTVSVEDGKAYLVGKIRMGRFSLLPRSGMDLTMQVSVADRTGRVLFSQRVAHDPEVRPGDYPVRIPLDECQPGQQYRVEASASMGGFFDDLAHDELFVMPDPAKL